MGISIAPMTIHILERCPRSIPLYSNQCLTFSQRYNHFVLAQETLRDIQRNKYLFIVKIKINIHSHLACVTQVINIA